MVRSCRSSADYANIRAVAAIGRMTGIAMGLPLDGCTVVSLRPAGMHASMRRAAAASGARLLALSPWRLRILDDPRSRAALAAALGASRVVFTSPASVAAAKGMERLRPASESAWLAVGAGTAAALAREGVDAIAPQRMDSEGLLELDALQHVAGLTVGLVTAPGGRGEIEPALRRRGAQVLRADVYERTEIAPTQRAIDALRAIAGTPAWLALGSGAALDTILRSLPADAAAVLRGASVVAASERLARHALANGFPRVVVAASAMPADLVAAAAAAQAPFSAPSPR
jgi:uroporphyrinogen-III synthase